MVDLPEGVTQVSASVFQLRTPMDILYVNSHLVTGEMLALVDTGLPGTAALLREALAALSYGLADLDSVLITHGHPDHIGSCAQLRDDGHPYLIAPFGAKPWIEDHARQFAEFPAAHPQAFPVDDGFRDHWFSLMDGEAPVDLAFEGRLRVDLGQGVALESVSLPGHSAHETGYLELATRTLILGDAIALDLPQGFPAYVDPTAYRASLRRIAAMIQARQVEKVVAGHFPTMDAEGAGKLLAHSLRRVDEIERAVLAALGESPGGSTLRQVGERVASHLGLTYTFQTPATILGHLREMDEQGLAVQRAQLWQATGRVRRGILR